MMTEEYPDRDGRKVWLTRSEYADLLATDALEEPRRGVAVRLAGECGLRSGEVVYVRPDHLYRDDEAGLFVQVPEGKGDKYREVPIPSGLAEVVKALGHGREADPIVDVSTRSLRNWMTEARDELVDQDERWQFVTFHDLRRSWAGWLASDEVELGVAIRWGGWADLETAMNHYRSRATAKAQAREREKVPWL